MNIPPQLAVPVSADSVTTEVRKLLRAAEVKGLIPTPKAQILACVRLVQRGELDLSEYKDSLTTKSADLFYRAMRKIRGLLDRRTKEFYVDPTLSNSKRNFVTYH